MTIYCLLPWVQYVPHQGLGTPVIRFALKYGNLEVRRVQDSDSLPILAVPSLPALLSLFPLAFFTKASLWVTLLYRVAADIFSTLPMAIRAVELIVCGSKKYHSHMTDVDGLWTDDDIVVAITFAAECRMRAFIKGRGEIMLAIAIAVMFLGIAFEYLSRCVIARQHRKREWTGLAILHENNTAMSLKIRQLLYTLENRCQ